MSKDGSKQVGMKKFFNWQDFSTNEELLRQMASLPFNEAVGSKIDKLHQTVAGIATIAYIPSLGYSDGSANASYLNKAANSIYNSIFQGYTADTSFEAPDLEMYTIAVSQLRVAMEEFRRAFKAANKFANFNKYYGGALLRALNVDADSFRKQRADIAARFNVICDLIKQSFYMPFNLPIANRWESLVSNVFCDGLVTKSQLYVFVPKAYFRYSDTAVQTGTALVYAYRRTSNNDQTTASEFLDFIEQFLIGPLSYSTDVNRMSGAIKRVYGDRAEIRIPYLKPEDAGVDIFYDEETLHTIHNIEFVGQSYSGSTDSYIDPILVFNGCDQTGKDKIIPYGADPDASQPVVFQRNGAIISRPGIDYSMFATTSGDPVNPFVNRPSLINIHTEYPGPVDVLASTRGKYVIGNTTVGSSIVALFTGSEIYIGGGDSRIWYYRTNGELSFLPMGTNIVQDSNMDAAIGLAPLSRYFSNFDWYPIMYLVKGSGDGSPYLTLTWSGVIGDLENYESTAREVLRSMNERVFWQLLNVPANTKSVTK